ncbi:MAG: hypothetical protein R3282_02055 [Rhodothermales bacterium]|nr:hypothetical protein [Rhodothermales bacterium]
MISINHKPALAVIVALVMVLAGTLGCKDNPMSSADETLSLQADQTAKKHGHEDGDYSSAMPFADAESFFEFNTTDNDLGLQIFLDAEGWRQVMVSDPSSRNIVQINTRGELSELGITELRFESAEPSPAEVLALFPPGEYTFRGKKVDGGKLLSVAELSHEFAPIPTISPRYGEEVDAENTTVTWDAPGAEEVEVIIESEDADGTFDVIVPADVGSLDIPEQFLEAGVEYKLEILAYAENGNRTIIETTFNTAP